MHHFQQRFTSSVFTIGLLLVCMAQNVRAQDFQIPSPSSSIAEETITQLADAYIAIEKIQARANAELKDADDQADARQVIESAQNAIIQAVERTGLDVRDFNRLSEFAALDPTLSERIRIRVMERRPI
jgi:hypothetical protein